MCNDPSEAPKENNPKMLSSWSPQKQALPTDMEISSDPPSHSLNGTPMPPLFETGQRSAMEQLLELKRELREVDAETFWSRLMEGVTSISGAQYAFVASRPLEDSHDLADTERRPEDVNVYYDGVQTVCGDCGVLKRFPRSFASTDKVYLVCESLGSTMEEHMDECLPFEACLAVPLHLNGGTFARFGLMWTLDGLKRRVVSWDYLQMILHSLDDLILLRTSKETDHKKHAFRNHLKKEDQEQKQRRSSSHYPAPYHPPSGSPSFKPYARSLSHELRTPMQGVVGLLDVMHASVQEKLEHKQVPDMVSYFHDTRESIEAIQDSARRAIEAADNVVHAYDFNMQVPDTPELTREDDSMTDSFRSANNVMEDRPNILIEGSNISVNPYKRRRTNPHDWSYPSSPKQRSSKASRWEPSPQREVSPRTADVKSVVEESDKIVYATPQRQMEQILIDAVGGQGSDGSGRSTHRPGPIFPPLVLQYTKVRDLLYLVIRESLLLGGRPEYVNDPEYTRLGQRIEVRTRSSSGRASTKVINWEVDPSVPESLFFDEKDLTKLISCVFLNALKFTEAGSISIRITLSHKGRYVLITVRDTGTGIPETFIPNLFKAFAREDGSTTRSKEGLGLGLLVAKCLSRRLGGDLTCVRSSTSSPNRGSEFEIRLPMNPNDSVSRPSTPATSTPAPSQVSHPSPGSNSSSDPTTEHSRTVCASETASSRSISPGCTEHMNHAAGQAEVDLPEVTRRLAVAPRGTSFMLGQAVDKDLAKKRPLTFLMVEDNPINRMALIKMLGKLGYKDVYVAFDGREAVRKMKEVLDSNNGASTAMLDGNSDTNDGDIKITKRQKFIDVILMDLWMPEMDGYEATERILGMVAEHRQRAFQQGHNVILPPVPTVVAISADLTNEALRRAKRVGMEGYMTKPHKIIDITRLIESFGGGERGVPSAEQPTSPI